MNAHIWIQIEWRKFSFTFYKSKNHQKEDLQCIWTLIDSVYRCLQQKKCFGLGPNTMQFVSETLKERIKIYSPWTKIDKRWETILCRILQAPPAEHTDSNQCNIERQQVKGNLKTGCTPACFRQFPTDTLKIFAQFLRRRAGTICHHYLNSRSRESQLNSSSQREDAVIGLSMYHVFQSDRFSLPEMLYTIFRKDSYNANYEVFVVPSKTLSACCRNDVQARRDV